MKKKIIQLLMGLALLQNGLTRAEQSIELLANLSNLPAASGFEKPVRDYMRQQWQPFMSSLDKDGMGNLIGRHKNNQQGPHLLLMAHMDETGFIVASISDDGFIKVLPLGGIDSSVIYGQRWLIQTDQGNVSAYSGMDSPHLIPDKDKNQLPEKTAFFLDIGAVSRDQAQKQFHIRPGLAITPDSKFTPLSDRRYLAKALDDRIGLAAISDALAALKRQQPNQLYTAATVQEEVGLRGASTVFESTKADIAINIEVGIADDYPLLNAKRKNTIKLGKGPTLFVYDRSMIPNQELVKWVMDLAYKHHIPIQLELEPGYGEDGAKLQVSGTGVPTINLGIPMRYAHQHAGVFDKNDYEQMVKLLTLIIENFGSDAYKSIRNA